jgi:hypothetical protein
MSTAKNLNNMAGQIRRTETALRNLGSSLDLSDSDRKTLLSAAKILNLSGGKASSAAMKAKRAEEEKEKATAKALAIADELVKAWPTESVLDKVALCAMSYLENNMRRDLQEEKRNWKKNLDYWAGDALREISHDAAYQSVRRGKPVNELMSAAKDRLVAVKAHPRILALAERWQASIAAEQIEKSSAIAG